MDLSREKTFALSALKTIGILIGGITVWFGVATGLIFLAGGMEPRGLFDVFYVLWPGLLIVLIITGAADAVFFRKGFAFNLPGADAIIAIGPLSGVTLILYFLPIILNLFSRIFELIGWESIAAFLFAVRWDAPIMIVLGAWSLIAIISLVAAGFKRGREWISEKWTSLSNNLLLSI